MQGCRCRGQYGYCVICRVCYTMCQSMQKGFRDVQRSTEFSMQGCSLTNNYLKNGKFFDQQSFVHQISAGFFFSILFSIYTSVAPANQ